MPTKPQDFAVLLKTIQETNDIEVALKAYREAAHSIESKAGTVQGFGPNSMQLFMEMMQAAIRCGNTTNSSTSIESIYLKALEMEQLNLPFDPKIHSLAVKVAQQNGDARLAELAITRAAQEKEVKAPSPSSLSSNMFASSQAPRPSHVDKVDKARDDVSYYVKEIQQAGLDGDQKRVEKLAKEAHKNGLRDTRIFQVYTSAMQTIKVMNEGGVSTRKFK